MKQLQKLPIGIQAFETIRENDYLYVDKTEYIYRMIDQGMFYFVSRPRRFGKAVKNYISWRLISAPKNGICRNGK